MPTGQMLKKCVILFSPLLNIGVHNEIIKEKGNLPNTTYTNKTKQVRK